MKLANNTRKVQTNLPNESEIFRIASSSKAFKILSSNLYKDKPLAIIRELSCNAQDAHRAAGNENTPFEVHLPNDLHTELRIRDYGTGIKHEDIFDVYTVYFESTKTNNNDDIGGLGLGSKTPFSYTDTYTVTSYTEGTKRVYTAYLSENGTPTITMLSEEPSDEPSGLEVRMPVKPQDENHFYNAAQSFLPRLDPLPIVPGVAITPYEYIVKTDLYSIRKTEGYIPYNERKLYITMGPVAYNLDPQALQPEIKEEFSDLLQSATGLEIHAKIGDVEIQPSREELSYDKQSQQKISDMLRKVSKAIAKDIEKAVESMPTYFLAVQTYNELINAMPRIRHLEVKYQGREIKDNISLTRGVTRKLKLCFATHYSTWRYKTPKRKFSYAYSPRYINLSISDIKKVMIYDQNPKKPWIKKFIHNRDRLKDTLLLCGTTKDIKRTLREMGNPPVSKYSDLPEPPPETKSIHHKSTTHTKKVNIKIIENPGLMSPTTVNLEERHTNSFYWLGTKGNAALDPENNELLEWGQIASIKNLAENIGIIERKPLFALPRAYRKLEAKLPQDTNIITILREKAASMMHDPDLIDRITSPSNITEEKAHNLCKKLKHYVYPFVEEYPTSFMAHLIKEAQRVIEHAANKSRKGTLKANEKARFVFAMEAFSGHKILSTHFDDALERMIDSAERYYDFFFAVVNRDTPIKKASIKYLTQQLYDLEVNNNE